MKNIVEIAMQVEHLKEVSIVLQIKAFFYGFSPWIKDFIDIFNTYYVSDPEIIMSEIKFLVTREMHSLLHRDYWSWFMVSCIAADISKMICDFRKSQKNRFKEKESIQSSDIAVMITGMNEEKYAPETINSLHYQGNFPWENIFFVDDGSTDNTVNSILANTGIPKKNILSDKNIGKPAAMKRGVADIDDLNKYQWILALDADIQWSQDRRIPLEEIEKSGYEACAFNISPITETEREIAQIGTKDSKLTVKRKNLTNSEKYLNFAHSHFNQVLIKVLVDFQKIEYGTSMMGRKHLANHGNVHCASGAAVLMKIDRYREIMEKHSLVFTGDDQETTMWALIFHKMKIAFIDIPIYTHAPSTVRTWWRQRSVRWWPGTFRNMPMVNHIIINPDKDKRFTKRLRFSLIWEKVTVALDIFKLTYVFMIVPYYGLWSSLLGLYFIYLVACRYQYYMVDKYHTYASKGNPDYQLGSMALATTAYAVYTLMNAAARRYAWIYYFNKRYITQEWKHIIFNREKLS